MEQFEEWLSIDPVKGYRSVLYDRLGKTLVAPVTNEELSIPLSGQATCRILDGRAASRWYSEHVPHDSIPEERCSCGWYLLKKHRTYKPAIVMADFSAGYDILPKVHVTMECDMYGKIVEHEHYYRAESYVVTALILDRKVYKHKNHPLARELADRFQIEVKVRNVKGAVG